MSDVGLSRGQQVTSYLCELNDNVRGEYVPADPASIVAEDIDFFSRFSIVLCDSLPEQSLRKLASFLFEQGIPLVVIRCVGFVASLRGTYDLPPLSLTHAVAAPEHLIVESKPETTTYDLRVLRPFPQLRSLVDSFPHDVTHVPALVTLVRQMDEWLRAGNSLPETFKERKQFQAFVESNAGIDDENFREALMLLRAVWRGTSVPDEIKTLLEDPKAKRGALERSTPDFWFLVAATHEFVEGPGEGMLPLAGAIPDMTCDTAHYIALQEAFASKAAADVDDMLAITQRLLKHTGRPADAIARAAVKRFCLNIRNIRAIRFRSLEDEFQRPNIATLNLSSDPDSTLPWYLALRCADRFFDLHKRRLGTAMEDAEAEFALVRNDARTVIVDEMGLSDAEIPNDHLRELIRYGQSELHNVASMIGGVASQEIIKLITHQYMVVNNTWVLDAIKGVSNAFCL